MATQYTGFSHSIYGVQRAQCWPFLELKYYGSNREDFVFVRPPGVERFVLDSDNVWYGRLKLLFSIAVKTDDSDVVKKMGCAYVALWYTSPRYSESCTAFNFFQHHDFQPNMVYTSITKIYSVQTLYVQVCTVFTTTLH